jgi:hypothetical protein
MGTDILPENSDSEYSNVHLCDFSILTFILFQFQNTQMQIYIMLRS